MSLRLAVTSVAALLCIVSLGADGPPAPAAAPSPKAAGVTIYDPDPQDVWNRLHRAIVVRTVDGVDHGVDNPVPWDVEHLLRGDASAQALSVLDEVARTPDRLPGELTRALLQHDLWAAFDHSLMAPPGDLPAPRKALRARLAKVITLLAMTDAGIARLPDNYADAVRSGAFPGDFDPASPDRTFLPPDLFDTKGPWVELSDDQGRSVAPMHVESQQARSAFRIFMRCPGTRKETLAYMQKLNLFTTPWTLEPAQIATTYPGGQKVRWDPLRMDNKTPQFPEGTMFALVRQMTVINDKLELRATRLTQGVELRVFRHVGDGWRVADGKEATAQAFFELNMRRGDLMAGKAGGLHAGAKADVDLGGDRGRVASMVRAADGLACITCHNANGIFSVNTYRRGTNPQLFPAPHSGHSVERSLMRKQERSDWGVLRGVVEAGNAIQ